MLSRCFFPPQNELYGFEDHIGILHLKCRQKRLALSHIQLVCLAASSSPVSANGFGRHFSFCIKMKLVAAVINFCPLFSTVSLIFSEFEIPEFNIPPIMCPCTRVSLGPFIDIKTISFEFRNHGEACCFFNVFSIQFRFLFCKSVVPPIAIP